MTTNKRVVRGSVKVLYCENCGTTFPIFAYEVDSDGAEIGLYSAGSCDNGDLLLIDLTLDEWKSVQNGQMNRLPPRILDEFGSQFRMAHIVRVEESNVSAKGLSFSEFKDKYRPPTVFYSCPCCEGGEAIVQEEVEAESYIKQGNNISTSPSLSLSLSSF